MRLKYEPASEPLHISVKQLFLNGDRFSYAPGTKSTGVPRS